MDLNMPARCPKGHLSTDGEYCSECGAKMAATPSGLDAANAASAPMPGSASPSMASVLAAAQSGSTQVCPDCGTPRAAPTTKFCEVCRYNFVTSSSWGAPKVTAQPASPDPVRPATTPMDIATTDVVIAVTPGASTDSVAPSAPTIADLATGSTADSSGDANGITLNPVASLPADPYSVSPSVSPPYGAPSALMPDGAVLRWEAHLTVDPSLNTDPDPDLPCPIGEPERIFPLDFAENLIGRRSERRGIFPEINVNDPCASHRHAKLLRQPDSSFALLDLGSTNGTMLNGVEIPPNVLQPLKAGDQITLGCWTRIVLQGLRS